MSKNFKQQKPINQFLEILIPELVEITAKIAREKPKATLDEIANELNDYFNKLIKRSEGANQ